MIIWIKRLLLIVLLFFLVDFVISVVLLRGVNSYFGLNSNAEILINGSSMSIAGFNKGKIEGATKKKVAFYSRNGVSLSDRSSMLEHYFNLTTQKTEIAVLEVNPLLFSERYTAANVFMLFLPFMDDPAMDSFIRSEIDIKQYWVRKLVRTSRYDLDLFSLAIKGHFGISENKKNQVLDTIPLEGLKREFNSIAVEFNREKVKQFENTLALTKNHSNKIILVNMPIFEAKMKTFKNNDYQVFKSFLDNYVKSHEGVLFLDLNIPDITANPNYFSDPLHLNASGQEKASEVLLKFIGLN
jgi:hypothetical protein